MDIRKTMELEFNLLQNPQAEELTTESFKRFLSGIGELLLHPIDTIFNNTIPAITDEPVFNNSVYSDLTKRGYLGMEGFGVYAPQNVTGPFLSLVTVLDAQFGELGDIEKRLFKPILDFLTRVASWDEFGNKEWETTNFKQVDVQRLRAVLGIHYTQQADVKVFKPFEVVYERIGDVKKIYDILDANYDSARKVKLDNIKNLTKEINEVITYILKKRPEAIDNISDKNRKELVDLLNHAASEVEHLAAVIFDINRSITIHNKNIARFKEEL